MREKRWGILIFCCVLLLSVGVLYAWSALVIPLEGEYGWSRMATSGVFTVSICGYCMGNLISGALSAKATVRGLLLGAAGFMVVGFGIAGMWHVMASVTFGYGILCSCGVGMAYNTILGYCVKWFPDKPGLCNGILLTAYGLSTFVIAAAATWLIGKGGWGVALWTLGVFEGGILVIGALLLARLQPNASMVSQDRAVSENDVTPRQMLRSGSFYVVFFWLMIVTASGLAATGSAAQMALALDVPVSVAAAIPGVITACGCIGRLGFGKLFDALGHGRTVLWDSILQTAAMAIMAVAFLLNHFLLMAAGLVLLGISYGGMASICAALMRKLYGAAHYPYNFSISALQMIPASLLGPLLGSSIYVTWNSYAIVCVVLFGLNLIGVGLSVKMKSYGSA